MLVSKISEEKIYTNIKPSIKLLAFWVMLPAYYIELSAFLAKLLAFC